MTKELQSALPTELPRQLSWLDPNLTFHSTPDEQANHQLSMKEKAVYIHSYIVLHMYIYIHVHVHLNSVFMLFVR